MNTSFVPNWRVARSLSCMTLSLPLLLSQSACSANTPIQMHKEKTNPYYVDAQLCRARHPDTKADATPGIASTLDMEGYLTCMRHLGYQQDAKTDPLIKALELCRQGSVTYSASGAQGARPQTPDGFRDCLRLRGFGSPATTR